MIITDQALLNMPNCLVDVWSHAGVGSAFRKVLLKYEGRTFAFIRQDSHMRGESENNSHAFDNMHRYNGHIKLAIVWQDASRHDALLIITTSDNMHDSPKQLS